MTEIPLDQRIIGLTVAAVLRESQWIIQGLHGATLEFVEAPLDEQRLAELSRWRRLAFRMLPAEIEALASANRSLSQLSIAKGSSNATWPHKLDDDRAWRRLAMNQRFNVAIDAALEVYGLKRKREDKSELGDLLGKLRESRRQIAHPKFLTDLVPDERETEVLRRAMIKVFDQEVRIVVRAIGANEDLTISQDVRASRPLREIPSQRGDFEAVFDEGFYREVESSRDKTDRLVDKMLQQLGGDSLWAFERARDYDEVAKASEDPNPFSPGGRVLGVTFFSEIEGVCAIFSRAVLYANNRREVTLTAEEKEWLECVCGERNVRNASSAVRAKLGLENQIKLALEFYDRVSPYSLEKLLDDPSWSNVVQAIDLRNKLYHPRGAQDIIPTSDDTLNLLDAMGWFRKCTDRLSFGAR